MAWRDSRQERERLLLFSLSLVAGVSSMAAIHALRFDAERALISQEKSLLGADVQIASRQEFNPQDVEVIRKKVSGLARETAFSSMLQFGEGDRGGARLVQVRGFEGDYPFYGKVESEPSGAWTRVKQGGGILVEAALLDQFDAKVGDSVKLGDVTLEIAGVIRRPVPRSSRFGGFAPEVYIALEDLKRSGLLGSRSLAFHYLQIQVSEPGFAEWLAEIFKDRGWRIETPANRRESLGDAMDNLRQFLSLLAMSAIVLGAIGVSSAMHSHLNRRMRSIAVLRCLGCSGSAAMGIYFVQTAVLGLIGAVLGGALGALLHVGISTLLRVEAGLETGHGTPWFELAQASGVGFLVCIAFALLPLLRVRRAKPSGVLREGNASSEGFFRNLDVASILVMAGMAGALIGLAWFNTGTWSRALVLSAVMAAVFLFLWLTSKGLVVMARWLVHPDWPYELRQGIANLHRPNNQTLLFLLSLGLGTFLILTILFARNQVTERATVSANKDGPGLYLVDVQADQVDGVVERVKSLNYPVLEVAPMITMRIASVRGIPSKELGESGKIPAWILQREFRSSYRHFLNETEKVIAGSWSSNPATPGEPVPLSLEKELAADLGVRLGDPMELDVQGLPIACVITSIREVDWSRFNLNFFMLFPPGVLENAPGFFVITTRLPVGETSGLLQRDLAREFPNVSVIDLVLILETIRTLVNKILAVVGVLSGFALIAGLMVLTGTLWNGREARRNECRLLRVLGASRAQVQRILSVEYCALGLLSGLAGIVPAVIAHFALAIWVFKSDILPSWELIVAACVLCTAAAWVAGQSLGRGICDHPSGAIRGGG